jgi:hypothetical protein
MCGGSLSIGAEEEERERKSKPVLNAKGFAAAESRSCDWCDDVMSATMWIRLPATPAARDEARKHFFLAFVLYTV